MLALPFSLLRTVDFSKAGFDTRKTRAIRELPMGTNSKLNVGFKTRHWRGLGCTGDTYADTGYQATWEVSRAQPGTPGILVDYTGGRIGDSFGSGTPVQRAQKFLGQIEPVLPGITKQFDGNATRRLLGRAIRGRSAPTRTTSPASTRASAAPSRS